MSRSLVLLLVFAAGPLALAQDYRLNARQIAPDTYVFAGLNEDFSFENGGNIVNTGFIVTTDGVLVINTGPSKRYGEQMRAAIARVTDKPILRVYISKLHPDHFLGNQAFGDVPIAALAGTIEGIKLQGETFTDNMYRLVGPWMQGTGLLLPNETVEPGRQALGGNDIEFTALDGHTPSDLVIYDRTTGVLFAGGLVFHQRAPTTPHADLDRWIAALDLLETLDARLIVPSHGPIADDKTPIQQTRDYLRWLKTTFRDAAQSGLDMAEVLYLRIPEPFRSWAVMPVEYHRSVSHLYETFEANALPLVARPTD